MLADAGYFSDDNVKLCEDEKITSLVAKSFLTQDRVVKFLY